MKIALLGVSHWHVPLYLPGLAGHEVVGISDDDLSLAQRMAAPYGCPVFTDYKELVSKTKPDFVFAFAPHHRMQEVSNFLIDAEVGFTMEKPCGLNQEEVSALYDHAQQKKAFCAIPFVWRYSDTVNSLKNEYLKKQIAHLSFKFVAGPPSRYLATSKWMLEERLAGGGCQTNLGVHFIDMALYLTDSKKCETLASVYQYLSCYDIETYASSMCALDNDATLLLETGYAYPMTETEKRENRWTIVTEDSYCILADNNLELRTMGQPTQHIALNTDSDPYYEIFAKVTLDDFDKGIRPRASLEEMLKTRIILDDMNSLARARRRK